MAHPVDKSLPSLEAQRYVAHGQSVIHSEIAALSQLADRLDDTFAEVVGTLLECRGNVVLSGVGKPYIIAQKIAASLSSTGTPAITLHPVDALHGDLGRVRNGDVMLLFSRSGASPEVLELARAARSFDVVRVAVTARVDTALAKECELTLTIGEPEEADHLGVIPSATTTVMLALGDALTLTLAEIRGLTPKSYARLHPAGTIGRRLRLVADLMRPLDQIAVVGPDAPVLECLGRITEQRCGAALICDPDGMLLGIFTDGDLRRSLERDPSCLSSAVRDLMSTGPKVVQPDSAVTDACELLMRHSIDEVPVVDADGRLVGQLDIQDVV